MSVVNGKTLICLKYTECGVLLPQVGLSACLAFVEEGLGTYEPRLFKTKCFSTFANLASDRRACATYFARGPPIMLA